MGQLRKAATGLIKMFNHAKAENGCRGDPAGGKWYQQWPWRAIAFTDDKEGRFMNGFVHLYYYIHNLEQCQFISGTQKSKAPPGAGSASGIGRCSVIFVAAGWRDGSCVYAYF